MSNQSAAELLPLPTAKEWADAVKGLKSRKPEQMIDLLRGLDMRIDLVRVFDAALEAADEADKAIAGDAAGKLREMEQELQALSRSSAISVDEAQKIGRRVAELESLISAARNATELARVSRNYKGALEIYFPSLFGRDAEPMPVPGSGTLPGKVLSLMTEMELGLNQFTDTWLEADRPQPIKKGIPRRIVAAGVNQR